MKQIIKQNKIKLWCLFAWALYTIVCQFGYYVLVYNYQYVVVTYYMAYAPANDLVNFLNVNVASGNTLRKTNSRNRFINCWRIPCYMLYLTLLCNTSAMPTLVLLLFLIWYLFCLFLRFIYKYSCRRENMITGILFRSSAFPTLSVISPRFSVNLQSWQYFFPNR